MAGPLPLKLSEIVAYCELFQIRSVTERERLFDIITSLDDVYLEYVANKQKANSPAGPAKNPP